MQISRAVLPLVLVFFCPDFHHLLVATGPISCTRMGLTEYHINGRPNDPVIGQELRDVLKSIEPEQEAP